MSRRSTRYPTVVVSHVKDIANGTLVLTESVSLSWTPGISLLPPKLWEHYLFAPVTEAEN